MIPQNGDTVKFNPDFVDTFLRQGWNDDISWLDEWGNGNTYEIDNVKEEVTWWNNATRYLVFLKGSWMVELDDKGYHFETEGKLRIPVFVLANVTKESEYCECGGPSKPITVLHETFNVCKVCKKEKDE